MSFWNAFSLQKEIFKKPLLLHIQKTLLLHIQRNQLYLHKYIDFTLTPKLNSKPLV